MKRNLFLIVSLLFVCFSCKQEEPEPLPIAVEAVELNKTSLTLKCGESAVLVATIHPDDAENQGLSWYSTDDAIVTVNNGKVTAISAGEASIIVETDDGGYAAECMVTVEDNDDEVVEVERVTLNKESVTMVVGDEITLSATVEPSNATNKNVSWSTSSSSVASVSNGKVKAISSGTAKITVITEDGGCTAVCTVTVTQSAGPSWGICGTFNDWGQDGDKDIVMTQSSHENYYVATSVQLSSSDEFKFRYNNDLGKNYGGEDKYSTFSPNTKYSTVSNGKNIKVAKGGTYDIYLSKSYDKFYIMDVNKAPDDSGNAEVHVENVELNESSLSMYVGDEYQLTAEISPSNATNKTVVWESSNYAVASVVDGMVKANKEGSARITVKTNDGGKTACCELVVNPLNRTNLSEYGTANCYIVSEKGFYKFTPTKGNGTKSVGVIASVETLWETFGTNITPTVGDLVMDIKYENEVITFKTPDTFNEGNAVIAAKDANGNILWSWHIWLTDEPEEQVYYNNAGTMMDRNLGATSSTSSTSVDYSAVGLLYQWGRKDPFLGASSLVHFAESTITWPSSEYSNSTTGTIAYATSNPTTFILGKHSDGSFDWHYDADNTRWTESATAKSIYDPCPAGWRVPDGGNSGVWSKALGSSLKLFNQPYDKTNESINFSGKFGASTIWYPTSGYRSCIDGTLEDVHQGGYYHSASLPQNGTNTLYLNCNGSVNPSNISRDRADAMPVRCVRE